MDICKILKKLIDEKSIVKLDYLFGKYSCKLVELESNYSLEIKNVPEDMIVIKCDNFPDTKKFFKGNYKECKRADFILISNLDSTIFIIELKRSKSSSLNSDIIAQLKGATCVIYYCEMIADQFLGYSKLLNGFKFKYFKYRSIITKRSFYNYRDIQNDTPESAKIIGGKTIQYKKLLLLQKLTVDKWYHKMR